MMVMLVMMVMLAAVVAARVQYVQIGPLQQQLIAFSVTAAMASAGHFGVHHIL